MRRLTTTEFIKRANTVHNNKYTYTSTEYINWKTKVTISCQKHGDFSMRPNSHTSGKQGCPVCGIEDTNNANRDSLETFLKKAQVVHGDKYDYSKSVYSGSKSKLIITCSEHGDFEQTPNNHLSYGCLMCGGTEVLTTEQFITRCSSKHNNKYSYTKVSYKNTKTKVDIICPKHGLFQQKAGAHLAGSGCSKCTATGFNASKPGLLYYFKVTDGVNTAWKIGITNHSIKRRYSLGERLRISDIVSVWYEQGQEAYDEEQRLLNKFKESLYTGPNLLIIGNTELFNKDILNL